MLFDIRYVALVLMLLLGACAGDTGTAPTGVDGPGNSGVDDEAVTIAQATCVTIEPLEVRAGQPTIGSIAAAFESSVKAPRFVDNRE